MKIDFEDKTIGMVSEKVIVATQDLVQSSSSITLIHGLSMKESIVAMLLAAETVMKTGELVGSLDPDEIRSIVNNTLEESKFVYEHGPLAEVIENIKKVVEDKKKDND